MGEVGEVPKNIIALLDLFNTGSLVHSSFKHSMKAGIAGVIVYPSWEICKNYRDFSSGISMVLKLLLFS